jgi:hypothetical protein
MNIFILDDNPIKAAQMQCDKHVVKMIVESAQILSTAHRMLDGTMETRLTKSGRKGKYYYLSDPREDILYKAVHHNHPCTVWTMESRANYSWHYIHFVALCDEYTYRYDKIHATDTKLKDQLSKIPDNLLINKRTPFKLAMNANPECVVIDNPIESYRNYYQTKQGRFKMSWTNRTVPEWFNANL